MFGILDAERFEALHIFLLNLGSSCDAGSRLALRQHALSDEKRSKTGSGEPMWDGDVPLWRVEAGAYEEAMTIHSCRLGFGPYKPLGGSLSKLWFVGVPPANLHELTI
jgi:hypothetical protein